MVYGEKELVEEVHWGKAYWGEKTELKRLGFTGSDGDGSLVDHTSENGEDIDPEEFYSDEEDESKKFKGKRLGGVFKRETKYETDGNRKIGEVD